MKKHILVLFLSLLATASSWAAQVPRDDEAKQHVANSVDSEQTCEICYKRLSNPIFLQCLHNQKIHTLCFAQHAKKQLEQGIAVGCPICNVPIHPAAAMALAHYEDELAQDCPLPDEPEGPGDPDEDERGVPGDRQADQVVPVAPAPGVQIGAPAARHAAVQHQPGNRQRDLDQLPYDEFASDRREWRKLLWIHVVLQAGLYLMYKKTKIPDKTIYKILAWILTPGFLGSAYFSLPPETSTKIGTVLQFIKHNKKMRIGAICALILLGKYQFAKR